MKSLWGREAQGPCGVFRDIRRSCLDSLSGREEPEPGELLQTALHGVTAENQSWGWQQS